MDTLARVQEHFADHLRIVQAAEAALADSVARAGDLLSQALLQDGKILACGSGGSAADAQHFASALLNRFEMERPGLPAVALTADTATLSAIATDYSFDDVYSQQVRALGRPADVLLAISTSGNPESICRAIDAAHERGMNVVVLGGHDGGRVADQVADSDVEIRVPDDRPARILEVHRLLLHCLCDLIDTTLLGGH